MFMPERESSFSHGSTQIDMKVSATRLVKLPSEMANQVITATVQPVVTGQH